MANNKTTTFSGQVLDLLLNNTAAANIGDAAGLQPSAADGNLYISLHTADPGVGGSQTTNELTYTGYSRVAVARTGALWTVVGNAATNAAAITFGLCTVGVQTAAAVGVGTDASPGAGHLLLRGLLSANLDISPGITPKFDIGDFSLTET